MLNVAFCDDDKCFLDSVLPIIYREFKKYNVNIQIKQYQSGQELIEDFEEKVSYSDIIFLDIDMPQMNGKVVAKKLRAVDKNFKLIFMTAYEQEALNMFQYDVIGFLPKSNLDKYMPDTVARVVKKIEEEMPMMQFFQIYSSKGAGKTAELKIALNNIIFFEIINREIQIHTIFGAYQLYHCKFSDIVKKYVKLGFLDIHRTCIVNAKYVVSVGETSVDLDNGESLLMSRRKRKQVLGKFLDDIYIGGA